MFELKKNNSTPSISKPVNKHKLWLGVSVMLALLIISVVLLYPLLQKKSVVGQAISGTNIVCTVDANSNIIVGGKTIVSQCISDPFQVVPPDWVGYDISSILQKYTCENGFLKSSYEQCYCQKVNGIAMCKDQSSFTNVLSCGESDAGDNPALKSSLTYNGQSSNDACVSEDWIMAMEWGDDYNNYLVSSGNYLVENYCQANFIGIGMWKIPNYAAPYTPSMSPKLYNCNCYNGACSCPTGTTGTYPECKCDGVQVFSVNENKCVDKLCPTGTTGNYPNCWCSESGKVYDTVKDSCVLPDTPMPYNVKVTNVQDFNTYSVLSKVNFVVDGNLYQLSFTKKQYSDEWLSLWVSKNDEVVAWNSSFKVGDSIQVDGISILYQKREFPIGKTLDATFFISAGCAEGEVLVNGVCTTPCPVGTSGTFPLCQCSEVTTYFDPSSSSCKLKTCQADEKMDVSTGMCVKVCPSDASGNYPECVCSDAAKYFDVGITNMCKLKVCPLESMGKYPYCGCNGLFQYNESTNTCIPNNCPVGQKVDILTGKCINKTCPSYAPGTWPSCQCAAGGGFLQGNDICLNIPCPAGATGLYPTCECTDSLQEYNTNANKCYPKCINGEIFNPSTGQCSKVCPNDASGTYSQCKCLDSQKYFDATSNSCVDMACPTGKEWKQTSLIYESETSKFRCACSNGAINYFGTSVTDYSGACNSCSNGASLDQQGKCVCGAGFNLTWGFTPECFNYLKTITSNDVVDPAKCFTNWYCAEIPKITAVNSTVDFIPNSVFLLDTMYNIVASDEYFMLATNKKVDAIPSMYGTLQPAISIVDTGGVVVNMWNNTGGIIEYGQFNLKWPYDGFKKGIASQFKGDAKSFISIPTTLVQDHGDDTISVWAKHEKYQATIFTARNVDKSNNDLELRLESPTNIIVTVKGVLKNISLAPLVLTQKWNNYILRRNHITGEINFYLNGKLIQTWVGPTGKIGAVSDYRLGSFNSNDNTLNDAYAFKGLMAKFGIYGAVLDEVNITQLATEYPSGICGETGQCGSGAMCIVDMCYPSKCVTDQSCSAGFKCVNQVCIISCGNIISDLAKKFSVGENVITTKLKFFESGPYTGCTAGDINADGVVDGNDILPFIAEYRKFKSNTKGQSKGDVNNDGKIDGDDILPFIARYREFKLFANTK